MLLQVGAARSTSSVALPPHPGSVTAKLYGLAMGGGAFGREDIVSTFTIGRSSVLRTNTRAHRLVAYATREWHGRGLGLLGAGARMDVHGVAATRRETAVHPGILSSRRVAPP